MDTYSKRVLTYTQQYTRMVSTLAISLDQKCYEEWKILRVTKIVEHAIGKASNWKGVECEDFLVSSLG
jgi:hypothetical protein